MGIGGSLFLLALGAILAFAVHYTVSGVDLQVVGLILMAAGLVGLVLFLAVFGPRRRSTVVRDETTYRSGPRETYRRDEY